MTLGGRPSCRCSNRQHASLRNNDTLRVFEDDRIGMFWHMRLFLRFRTMFSGRPRIPVRASPCVRGTRFLAAHDKGVTRCDFRCPINQAHVHGSPSIRLTALFRLVELLPSFPSPGVDLDQSRARTATRRRRRDSRVRSSTSACSSCRRGHRCSDTAISKYWVARNSGASGSRKVGQAPAVQRRLLRAVHERRLGIPAASVPSSPRGSNS